MNGRCGWLFGWLVVLVSSTSARDSPNYTENQNENRSHSDGRKPSRLPHHDKEMNDTKSGVTCYTCVNVSDNLVCNRYAIDRPCPRGESFCHTLHIMDSRGDSVIVNKKCADHTECSTERVGCLQIDSQKVCVSCCDEMYCNVSAPTNLTTALFSNTRARTIKHLQDVTNRADTASYPVHSISASIILLLAHILMPGIVQPRVQRWVMQPRP